MHLLRVMWIPLLQKGKVGIKNNTSGTGTTLMFGRPNGIMEVGRHMEDSIAVQAFPRLARHECVELSLLKKSKRQWKLYEMCSFTCRNSVKAGEEKVMVMRECNDLEFSSVLSEMQLWKRSKCVCSMCCSRGLQVRSKFFFRKNCIS